eukprot:TRINITY_DN71999_c0_g1_i1.p1 TRINITY_DN71999_c0_g1~~TRINITY_DN71999_c0_g1_i1.p1  ORF type:complete len:243 (-),score=33.87 TRINITY_DN71999_c0_g1_i1:244-972(-)
MVTPGEPAIVRCMQHASGASLQPLDPRSLHELHSSSRDSTRTADGYGDGVPAHVQYAPGLSLQHLASGSSNPLASDSTDSKRTADGFDDSRPAKRSQPGGHPCAEPIPFQGDDEFMQAWRVTIGSLTLATHGSMGSTSSASNCADGQPLFVKRKLDQLSVVQEDFSSSVLSKVLVPNLLGMSKRQREVEVASYRNELKVAELKEMGYADNAARQALERTHQKNMRKDQHIHAACDVLTTERM